MSDKIRICIADDNIDLAESWANYLSQNERIYVAAICKDGRETLDTVLKMKIDVLLIDIIMPKIDGIEVINEIDRKFKEGEIDEKPNIIIVSALLHDNLKFDIFSKGVNFYMTKPADIDMLQKRIIEIFDYEKNSEYREKVIDENVTEILYKIGIYPNLIGYKYMKRAIEILVRNPMINKDFRKKIYTELAKEDETDVAKIEKSIINAVNTSWQKEKENVSEILKDTRYHSRKPTTSILLTAIAEEIRNKAN